MAQFNLTITLEYDIITASDSGELVTKVNERIREGWQPLGGIAVTKDDDSWIPRIFYQAMVREKPDESQLAALAEEARRLHGTKK